MKRPSPVFHVDGERGLRGGERQLLYLAAALRARGRRGVIYGRAGEELQRESERQGFEFRALPFLFDCDPLSAARLALDARREGAIVHAHSARAAGIAAAARLGGARYVAHRRVDFAVTPWKYARAERAIAVSEAIARMMREAGLRNVSVIPDGIPASAQECSWAGIEPARFSPPSPEERARHRAALAAELNIDPAAPWIGNLAALVPHKDHDNLLAASLLALFKRPEARVLIAGRGPEEERLFGQIRRLNLTGKVLLIGHRPDPLPLLKSLDLYVQSSWGEGMGSVLIEAAACGVPIAATRAGGIPEVVEDGQTGLLAPPRNPEALAAAMLRLLDDPALARRLAATGLERLPRFGLARMADDMEKIYDSLA